MERNRSYKTIIKEMEDTILELRASLQITNFKVGAFCLIAFLGGLVLGIMLTS